MKIFQNFLLLLILFFISAASMAKNWDVLFDHSQYQNAKISPDGKYLAISLRHENRGLLFFLDSKTLEAVGSVGFQGNYEPGQYYWANNERVVIKMVKRVYSKEEPAFYGELYAVNFDGSNGEMIYGYQAGEMQTGSRIRKKEATRGWGDIIDILPEDDTHILISSTPMSKTGERLASALKLNIYTGVIKKDYGRAPIAFANFLTDTHGELKAISGTDRFHKKHIYLKNGSDWGKLPQDTTGSYVKLLSLSKSGKYLYTLDNHKQDLQGIFKLNLEDLSYTNVYTDRAVDITDVEMTTNGRSAFAIRVDENYPAYLILEKNNEEAKTFKTLLKSFPYSEVNITSRTQDGNFYIVHVSSDIDPGSLYLFDKKQQQSKLLFKFYPNIKNSDLMQVEPIKLTASDGQTIHGYFTEAKNTTKKKPAPLVIMVHGGPHGVRDLWGYSNSVQYLALNGYSVLQVNYRGSDGYGQKFKLSGYRAWGSLIQQDIYNAYQWLIEQNKASAGNACIMGASFGAYSAIQSAAIYPNTYNCAIANAGVYDLELIHEENNSRAVASFWDEALGTNTEQLRKISPVYYADKIKAPLLIAHGEDDDVAPIEHAERLREALDKANKPYDWYVVDKEGHGFYNPENQKAYMKKVLYFLDKHLK